MKRIVSMGIAVFCALLFVMPAMAKADKPVDENILKGILDRIKSLQENGSQALILIVLFVLFLALRRFIWSLIGFQYGLSRWEGFL